MQAPEMALQADGVEQAENQAQGGHELFQRSVRLVMIDTGPDNVGTDRASGLYLWDGSL